MPDAMKPPRKLTKIFLRCWLSYTSILWKSSVAAAFYADIAICGAEKATKDAMIRAAGSRNGPSVRRNQFVMADLVYFDRAVADVIMLVEVLRL
jgi:hypothetical protein